MNDAMESRMKTVERELGWLNKVVRDGNGQPAMMTRVSLLEQHVKNSVWLMRFVIGMLATAVVELALVYFRIK